MALAVQIYGAASGQEREAVLDLCHDRSAARVEDRPQPLVESELAVLLTYQVENRQALAPLEMCQPQLAHVRGVQVEGRQPLAPLEVGQPCVAHLLVVQIDAGQPEGLSRQTGGDRDVAIIPVDLDPPTGG